MSSWSEMRSIGKAAGATLSRGEKPRCSTYDARTSRTDQPPMRTRTARKQLLIAGFTLPPIAPG